MVQCLSVCCRLPGKLVGGGLQWETGLEAWMQVEGRAPVERGEDEAVVWLWGWTCSVQLSGMDQCSTILLSASLANALEVGDWQVLCTPGSWMLKRKPSLSIKSILPVPTQRVRRRLPPLLRTQPQTPSLTQTPPTTPVPCILCPHTHHRQHKTVSTMGRRNTYRSWRKRWKGRKTFIVIRSWVRQIRSTVI